MTAIITTNLGPQLELPLVDVAEQQRSAIEGLGSLAMGEIVYFRPLPGEGMTAGRDRLLPLIHRTEKSNGIKLLVKNAGSVLRVRRIPSDGATGRLAEWWNLLPGQSDTLYEHLSDDEYPVLNHKAHNTADRLRESGRGYFRVVNIDYMCSDRHRILVYRFSDRDHLLNEGRPRIY